MVLPDSFQTFNAKLLDQEKADFLFQESKSYLDSYQNSLSSLESKSIHFLNVIFVIFTALAGFVSTIIVTRDFQEPYCVMVIGILFFMSIPLGFSAFFLIKNLLPKDYTVSGNEPLHLFNNQIAEKDYNGIVFAEALTYHVNIEKNKILVTKMSKNLEEAVDLIFWTLLLTPFVLIGLYGASQFFVGYLFE